MSKIDDGGPAFPTEPNKQPGFYLHHGMSLRDWFAGQALAIVYMRFETSADPCPSDLAIQAYFIADAMLEARKVQP